VRVCYTSPWESFWSNATGHRSAVGTDISQEAAFKAETEVQMLKLILDVARAGFLPAN